MGDVSDIGELLEKARRDVRRRTWSITGLISVCTLVGTFGGAGWAAKSYLAKLEGDIDRLTLLMQSEGKQVDTQQDSLTKAHERVASCEVKIAVDEQAFGDLKAEVKDIAARSGILVRGAAH